MIVARVEDLAEALLHTDVDAIAANDTHIVLTVRVSREFLRENHSFLAHLSDFAAGADLPKRQAPRPAPEVPIVAPKPRATSRLRALMAGAFAALKGTMRAA
jgi:hypothetical protein